MRLNKLSFWVPTDQKYEKLKFKNGTMIFSHKNHRIYDVFLEFCDISFRSSKGQLSVGRKNNKPYHVMKR